MAAKEARANIVLACTECNTRAQVDAMVEKLGGLL